MVLDRDDLAVLDVDGDDHALDRMRVAVVGRGVTHVGDDADQTPVTLALDAEVARRPRVELEAVEVGDAPLGQRLDVARVSLGQLDRFIISPSRFMA